jgi:aspartate/methionine/tyrosine aminotransferase
MNNRWRNVIKAQPMFDVLSAANAREKTGQYVARMEIGDTPGFRNGFMHELLAKYVSQDHRYSPSAGEPSLIQALFSSQWPTYSQEEYSISVAPANFLITAALAAVTSPGDSVYIPDPGFPTYKLACDFLGLVSIPYSVYPIHNGRFPTLDERVASSKPKAIIVNNPSNPLGQAFDGQQIYNSIKSLTDSGVQVIMDETYINLVYETIDCEIPNAAAIRIRSFSKEHCAPGLRLGYVIAPKEFAQVISDFVSLTISCAPKFIQLAAAEYLSSENSLMFREEVKKEMVSRFHKLTEFVPRVLLRQLPNSAFYAMIETGDDIRSFNFLLENGVATCPGSKFGNSAQGAVRVSLAGSAMTFDKDLELLGSALVKWQSANS